MVLDREYVTFRAKLPELLATDSGRYVLIHGDDVIGTFETKEQALVAGWERWLFEPFLVEHLVADRKPVQLNWRGTPFDPNGERVTVLEQEMATYREKLAELLEKAAGRYVLIHGNDVIDTFETQHQAIVAGWERWLFEPFLVKQVVANEQPIRLD